MPVSRAVKPARKDTINTSEGIVNFDTDNLYPNTFESIIERSSTAKAVNDVRERFVYGRGMTESGDFWKKVINIKGLRVDQLARRIIRSYVRHGGFAVHFNYNAMFEKVSAKVVPFQHCRTGKPDDMDYRGKIVVYDRWKTKKASKTDINAYDVYNPDPEIIQSQVDLAGGWEKYKGQIWYFGENGETEYPLNPLHSVKNEMISEILIGEGKNSNTSNNFLAAQMFVLPGTFKELTPYADDEDGEEFEKEIMDTLQSMQGASNMGALTVFQNNVKDKDNNPVKLEVLKFDVQNLDKIHEYTERSCEEAIMKAGSVPPILIKPVATGFSTEILDSYYQYYNEVTAYDRQIIEESMAEIFRSWNYDINSVGNYAIKPLTLTIDKEQTETTESTPDTPTNQNAEAQATLRGSVGGVTGILSIQQGVASGTTDRGAAVTILMEIYGFDKPTAEKLLGTVTEEPDINTNPKL